MIFDRYVFRDLAVATAFIAVTLAVIILLTQSLRFLELVINSGASSAAFLGLTLLAMPRFFEVILPIAGMAATIFVYNRMTMDSEMVVMRAVGLSPMALARPALALSALTAAILLLITLWLTPLSLTNMQSLRAAIKAQYSTLLFREGVFNPVGNGVTVYIRARTPSGELRGLMIHDSRPENKTPVTILARSGVLVTSRQGQQVVVYDGSRQALDSSGRTLSRLNFDRYTIDLPEGSGPVRQRWREPEERSLGELLHPDPADVRDRDKLRDFNVEIVRRLLTPLFAPAFILISLAFLLVGPVDRRGQGWRIAAAIGIALGVEAGYLASFSAARHSNLGLTALAVLTFLPIAASLYFLDARSEGLRQKLWSRFERKVRR